MAGCFAESLRLVSLCSSHYSCRLAKTHCYVPAHWHLDPGVPAAQYLCVKERYAFTA